MRDSKSSGSVTGGQNLEGSEARLISSDLGWPEAWKLGTRLRGPVEGNDRHVISAPPYRSPIHFILQRVAARDNE